MPHRAELVSELPLLGAPDGVARGAELRVPSAWPTIGQAIAAARTMPGRVTIRLAPGVYAESADAAQHGLDTMRRSV